MTSNTDRDLTISDANGACACCAPGRPSGSEPVSSTGATVSTDLLVAGMTCAHCVASVTEELTALDGVEAVDIDLNAGGASRVTVASASPVDIEKVRAAVAEAGYDLVQPAP